MVNSPWKYPWHILNKKEIAYFLSIITVYVNKATPWKYGFIFCNWWIWTHKNWNAASRIKLKIICHKKASLILCPHTICWYIASPELVLRRWSSLPRMPRLLSYGWAVVRMPRLLIWQQLSTMKPSGASVEVASTQLCHPTSHLCNLALSPSNPSELSYSVLSYSSYPWSSSPHSISLFVFPSSSCISLHTIFLSSILCSTLSSFCSLLWAGWQPTAKDGYQWSIHIQ